MIGLFRNWWVSWIKWWSKVIDNRSRFIIWFFLKKYSIVRMFRNCHVTRRYFENSHKYPTKHNWPITIEYWLRDSDWSRGTRKHQKKWFTQNLGNLLFLGVFCLFWLLWVVCLFVCFVIWSLVCLFWYLIPSSEDWEWESRETRDFWNNFPIAFCQGYS